MDYRLGLDVGTASCGLIAWALDQQGNPSELMLNSLDIWSEPLLPAKSGGVGQSKKAARRAARMMRRGICRRARRLRRISHLASLLSLDATSIPPDKGQNIHNLRADAAEKKVGMDDLLRVFLHITKNRGPSGDWVYAESMEQKPKNKKPSKSRPEPETANEQNALEDINTEQEKKDIAGGVRKLERLTHEAAKAMDKPELTLGQFLHYRRERGESVILGKVGLYPSRRLVEREFDRIWSTQQEFYPVMRDSEIRRQFFDAIFFQRPLKSPAPMVGRCPLEPTLARSPAAQMCAQKFRIEKQISDLRWGIGRSAQPLSKEQKNVIRELLNMQGEAAFGSILKALHDAGFPGPQGRGLNMDRSSRESLKGNTTLTTFRKLDLESEWIALDEITQTQIINFLADLGSPDILDQDSWHSNFTKLSAKTKKREKRIFSPTFINFINLLRKKPKFARLSTMGFDSGRMSYSIKALKMLTALMQEGWDERSAIEQIYPDHFKGKQVNRELPLPKETGNTVVDVALRQIYRAVRRAIEEMKGPPSQIIIELSRNMALGLRQRGKIETKINVNKKARREAAKSITEHGEQVTEKKIQRYLLWEQQLHYCPYCNDRIELGEALGSETEREHILPRTLTRVGGKRNQLVLAHRACNNEKGNRTPWIAFGADETRWRIIEERAAQLEQNKQWGKAKLLLLKDWDDEVLDNEAIKGFTDRQFHEGSWIAKLIAQWLGNVCQDVSVSRGEMTAHLRRIWKLDTVIPEIRYESGLPVLDLEGNTISQADFNRHRTWWEGHNERAGGVPTDRKPDKRIDHRHHLVDALAISLTSRSLYMRMANNYKLERERERRGERNHLRLYHEPPIPNIRDLALNLIRNAEIRHKPDRHPDGALFDQTAYGISRKPSENGKHKLAIRKPLAALIDNKGSIEKTRKVLEKIESEITRNEVLKIFDERTSLGISLKQAFDEPIMHPQFKNPIHRVRLLGDSVDTAAEIVHENRNGIKLKKYYSHSGNAYLEVRLEGGKLAGKPRLVPVQQAMKEKGSNPPDGVLRFWKGDTIQLPDSTRHVVGIIAAQGGGQLRLVPVTETCTFGELKKRGLTMRTVSGDALAKISIIDV
ncbi:MAG TPA: type II CRISPR RNA-guided endonuclease Cas9 [Gammaproteobacteria bacterium]|nr:type II CRISPR RNA-guided endonuclease Cas9 [Gammaproteobacteria bacterium]